MKKLFCLALSLLLLTGCGQKQPEAATTAATQPPAPDPTPSGVYLLKEQVHYDEKDRKVVSMEVTFNEQMLPVTIFMDSGTDITYTPEYDSSGTFTGFSMSRMLYGEETVSHAQVNDHGDIIQKTADGKTTHIAYSYDASGRVIKKQTTVNGNLSSVKTWAYDRQGNLMEASSTDANGGYALVYENTYDGSLLTAIHCKFKEGETEHTESFTYDQEGRLTRWEQVSGEETTTTVYTYNEAGRAATETSLLNGEEYSRIAYSYNDRGLLSEKVTFSYGQLSGRTTYTWTTEPVQLTAAQCNVLEQLGVIV